MKSFRPLRDQGRLNATNPKFGGTSDLFKNLSFCGNINAKSMERVNSLSHTKSGGAMTQKNHSSSLNRQQLPAVKTKNASITGYPKSKSNQSRKHYKSGGDLKPA